MKTFFRTVLVFLVLVLFSFSSSLAVHKEGGVISITSIGPNFEHEILCKLFVDASSYNPNITIEVAAANNPSVVIQSFLIWVDEIDSTCTSKLLIFRDTVILDPSTFTNPSGYLFYWGDLATRSSNVTNIQTPTSTYQLLVTFFPPTGGSNSTVNSSPKFLMPQEVSHLSLNSNFLHSFEADDPDGDSLSFKIYNPFDAIAPSSWPNILGVNFNGNNSATNPIPGVGTPALNLISNSQKGLFTINPNQNGGFIFGVKCEEWRNGFLIGRTYLDCFVTVASGGNNLSVTLNPNLPSFDICLNPTIATSLSSFPNQYSFNWIKDPFANPSFHSISPQISPSQTGNYSVFINSKNTNFCQTGFISFPVTIPTVNTPFLLADFDTICQGLCDTIRVYNPQPGIQFQWFEFGTTSPVLDTGTKFVVCNPGVYYCVASVPGGGALCPTKTSPPIEIFTLNPAIYLSSGLSEIECGGPSLPWPTFSLQNPAWYSSYIFQWFADYGTGFIPVLGANSNTLPQIDLPGFYFLQVIDTITGCEWNSNSLSLWVDDPPFAQLSNTVFCQNGVVSLILSSNPAYQHEMMQIFPSPPGDFSYGQQSIPYQPSQVGSYYAILTNPQTGCKGFSDTVSVLFTNLAPPPFNPIPNAQSIFVQGGPAWQPTFIPDPNYSYTISFSGGSSWIDANAGIIFVDFNTVGCHEIIVTITDNTYQCQTFWTKKVYVTNNDCLPDPDFIYTTNLLSELTPNFVYTGDYLICETLQTDEDSSYFFDDANIYLVGQAFKYPNVYGGEATGPNIIVDKYAILNITSTNFYAYCDTMWGGILANQGATIDFNNSHLQDSYLGIRPNVADFNLPLGPNEKYLISAGGTFHNNFVSVTMYGLSPLPNSQSPGTAPIGGLFTSDPGTMAFPYDTKSNGESLRSEIGIDVYENQAGGMTIIRDNTFKDHEIGIMIRGTNNAIDTFWNIIGRNNEFATMVFENNPRDVFVEDPSILVPFHTSTGSQHLKYQTSFSNISALDAFGLYFEGINSLYMRGGDSFYGTAASVNIGDMQNQVYGVKGAFNTIELESQDFGGLDFGLYLEDYTSSLSLKLNGCRFRDNAVSVKIGRDTDVSIPQMNCNVFEADRDAPYNFLRYGFYFDEGAVLQSDIGGSGPTPQFPGIPYPAGNDWPVDTVTTLNNFPGTYPNFYDGSIITWSPPGNWFSFYFEGADDFDNPLRKYHRYVNEFVGEDPNNVNADAVLPSQFVKDEVPFGDALTCGTTIPMVWPTQLKVRPTRRSNKKEFFAKAVIYPNPVNSVLSIDFNKEFSGTVFIYGLRGDLVIKEKINSVRNTKLFLEKLPVGLYNLKILSKNGDLETIPVEVR